MRKIMTDSSASIGIIGGADGPTAILVTGSPLDWVIPIVVLAVIVAAAVILIRKLKKKK